MRADGRGYHRNECGEPQLRDSLVLFLDVLGAKEMAQGNAQAALIVLDQALAVVRPMAQDALDSPWYFSAWFSDNMALASPIPCDLGQGEPELGTFVRVASRVQLHLALEGVFTRGGLARGSHFMDSNLAFGPALVEAVDLERQAVYPRVLLGASAMALAHHHLSFYKSQPQQAPHNRDLWVDGSGNVFLNYLDGLFAYVGDHIEEAEDLLVRHADRVVEAMTRHQDNPHVSSKYLWLAGYHNFFCTVHGIERLAIDHPVPSPSFSGFGETSRVPSS